MIENLIFIFGGIFAGSVLGLIGAGSGIVSVVILVYFLNMPFHQAILVALINSIFSSTAGLIQNAINKNLNYKVILGISLSGLVFAPIGTKASLLTSKNMLELLYSLLTLVICYIMWKNAKKQDVVQEELKEIDRHFKKSNVKKYILIGSVAGFLSGFLGFSGGVIIVPGLVILLRQSMKDAAANSIAIIAITAYISVFTHYFMGNTINFHIAIFFAVGGAIGVYIGNILQKFASNKLLKQAFAIFLAILGSSILLKRVFFMLIG